MTVQLPLFNEMYVVERLLDSVAQIRYPRDRFQVQVLDDSTDETQEICQRKVAELAATGVQLPPALGRQHDDLGVEAAVQVRLRRM